MADNGAQVIVNTQIMPGSIPQGTSEFSSGICGCFEDCTTCIKGWFCMSCLMCEVSSKLGECMCLPFCCPGALVPLRTKLRTLYGIRGSILCDYCVIAHCGPLAVCQMDRELKARGISH